MKKNRTLSLNETQEVIIPPAYPTPGYFVFQKFKSLLAADQKRPSIPLHRLMKMTGLPLGTCHGWFSTDELQQVQALLCLMERLPEEEWSKALRPFLRDFPTIEHPRLAHDRETVQMLERLLSVRLGLTLIRGGTYEDRTFVLTALGHSFSAVDGLHRLPAGLDVHTPKSFVPIETITYFKESLSRQRLSDLVHEKWRQLRQSDAPFLLFNGILSIDSELSSEISSLACSRHIVVTDPVMSKHDLTSKRTQMAVRSLELSGGPGNLIQMQLYSHSQSA